MPRPALTPEQRRETRRAIRRAAAKLYSKNGLANISARTIAEAAGVSVGTIYTHFGNLTELMQSLWKEPVARVLSDLDEIAAANPDPGERLRALLDAYATFAREHHAVYRGAFLFVRPESLGKPEPINLGDDRFFRLLTNAIADGQSHGLFRTGDPRALAQSLWAGLHGAIALPVNMDRLAFDPPEQLTRHMIDALLYWLEHWS